MKRRRVDDDEDIVDRIRDSATTDPMTIEAMQEVVRVRREMAVIMRNANKIAQELEQCRNESSKTE